MVRDNALSVINRELTASHTQPPPSLRLLLLLKSILYSYRTLPHIVIVVLDDAEGVHLVQALGLDMNSWRLEHTPLCEKVN